MAFGGKERYGRGQTISGTDEMKNDAVFTCSSLVYLLQMPCRHFFVPKNCVYSHIDLAHAGTIITNKNAQAKKMYDNTDKSAFCTWGPNSMLENKNVPAQLFPTEWRTFLREKKIRYLLVIL